MLEQLVFLTVIKLPVYFVNIAFGPVTGKKGIKVLEGNCL